MHDMKVTQNLVEFQERLLQKIDAPQKNKLQGDLWLGFESHGEKYAVQLKNIREVVPARHKYMNLGGWLKESVLGALQHKGDLWVVLDGLNRNKAESVTNDLWEKRILLLDVDAAKGQIGVSIEKVLGNLTFFEEWDEQDGFAHLKEDEQKTIQKVRLDAAQNVWRVWDVPYWSTSENVQNLVQK
jgi:chemotaxis signal transduction protein